MAVAELSRGTGRRKESVARVRLVPGEGKFNINRGRSLENYFPNLAVRMIILEPLRLVGREKAYDIHALLEGGGNTGQAGAIRQGIARALVELDPELRITLKRAGMLTRDARAKERRKYGLKKARKAPQYSKR
jgi:small subunit ribosomal protein S9